MHFEQFIHDIVEEMERKENSGNYNITIGEMVKNNQVIKHALQIRQEGCVMAPNFYLEDYFESYQQGKSVAAIATEIWTQYQEFSEEEAPDCLHKFTREWAREHVVYRLVNYNANCGILKEVPHMVMEDLAIVFYLLVEQKESRLSSVRITYAFLEYLGLQEEELYSLAEENMQRLFPLYLAPIADTICKFSGEADSPFVFHDSKKAEKEKQGAFIASVVEGEPDSPFFVLTNASGLNGATVLLYDKVLEQLAAAMKSNLYVIPSSIHEVLVMPQGIMKRADINAMIQNVNESLVEKEEILSDHVYLYDPAIGQLSSC